MRDEWGCVSRLTAKSPGLMALPTVLTVVPTRLPWAGGACKEGRFWLPWGSGPRFPLSRQSFVQPQGYTSLFAPRSLQAVPYCHPHEGGHHWVPSRCICLHVCYSAPYPRGCLQCSGRGDSPSFRVPGFSIIDSVTEVESDTAAMGLARSAAVRDTLHHLRFQFKCL